MKSELLAGALAMAVLLGAGSVAKQIARPVVTTLRERLPPHEINEAQHDRWSVLGGYRSLAADALWVRLHATWERQDLREAQAMVRAVSAIDPRSSYFWRNGARMIAYDFTAWRIAAAGGYVNVTAKTQDEIAREQAVAALAHLDAALAVHPDNAELWIERGNIEYTRLRDFAAAAKSYRSAAEGKNAPRYAARLHGEMLRRLGRKVEALAWWVRLHPTLPPDDEDAAADVVLARVRELERELGVAPEKAYVIPPRTSALR